jgi:hypothetical protein
MIGSHRIENHLEKDREKRAEIQSRGGGPPDPLEKADPEFLGPDVVLQVGDLPLLMVDLPLVDSEEPSYRPFGFPPCLSDLLMLTHLSSYCTACFKARTNPATSLTIPGFPRPRSIHSTMADPTITPSASRATVDACAGVLMPKPTAIGLSVNRRRRFRELSRPASTVSLAPVTPFRET